MPILKESEEERQPCDTTVGQLAPTPGIAMLEKRNSELIRKTTVLQTHPFIGTLQESL